jgi:hypothetical protein
MPHLMSRRRTTLAAAVLACVSSTGCTSAYMPRPNSHVTMVMDGGRIAFVRDGKKYEGGLLGGDIEEAVQGNAKAAEYASAYKTGMTTGFATTLLGLGGMLGGVALAGTEASEAPHSPSAPTPGLLVLAAGAVLYGIGLVVVLNAAPHLYDAVNVYNDGVDGAGPQAGGVAPAESKAH